MPITHNCISRGSEEVFLHFQESIGRNISDFYPELLHVKSQDLPEYDRGSETEEVLLYFQESIGLKHIRLLFQNCCM